MSSDSHSPSTPSNYNAQTPPLKSSALSISFKDFNVDSYAAKLVDPDLAIKDKLSIALELRDNVDQISQHHDYSKYLSTLIPAFLSCLNDSKPNFNNQMADHKFRYTILTLIHRLPPSPSINHLINDLFDKLLFTIYNDNEDNGWLCVKIIIDLVRSFKKECESPAKKFLECFKEMLENMPNVVNEVFPQDGNGICGEINSKVKDLNQSPKQLLQAFKSFKVITECPIAVVCIVQSYQSTLAQYMLDTFVSLSINVLSLQAGPQKVLHDQAYAHGKFNTSISPLIKNRQIYNDFIFSQVKTLSFIAYVCRAWHSYVTPYASNLANACLRLLKDCPSDLYSARKEILVATRHIAGISDIGKPAFINVFDQLLDEKIIVGSGIMTRETLRVLGMGLLADVFGAVRNELNLDQIVKTLNVALYNMLDVTLPSHAHSISIKTIVALVDKIINSSNQLNESSPKPHEMLNQIVDALIIKLENIEQFKTDLIKLKLLPKSRRYSKKLLENDEINNDKNDNNNNTFNDENEIEIESKKPIGGINFLTESSNEKVKDAKISLRFTLQAVLAAITAFKHLPNSLISKNKLGSEKICKLFRIGTKCFNLFDRRGDKEGNEVLETFFTILLRIDSLVFQDVIQLELNFLIDQILDHPPLFNAINVFLTHEPQSQIFLSVLLKYFVDNLEVFNNEDQDRITLFHKLFKHILSSISPPNDHLFNGYTSKIMLKSTKLALKSRNPYNYLILLKMLSQAIGGGRYEKFYIEIQPILQSYIDGLTTLLDESDKPNKDLIIQLFLILPMRFQVILPFLNSLVRPLCLALEQCEGEILEQALRLIEICVETLNPIYVDPILNPHIRNIQIGIYKLLKPVPHNHKLSHTAVRILGKLGGRNRKSLNLPANVNFNFVSEPSTIPIEFHDKNSIKLIDIKPLTTLSLKVLKDFNINYSSSISTSIENKFECSNDVFKSLDILKHLVGNFILNGVTDIIQENLFHEIMESLLLSTLLPPLNKYIGQFMNELITHVLMNELISSTPIEGLITLSKLTSITLDVLTKSLTSSISIDINIANQLVYDIIKKVVNFEIDSSREDVKSYILNQIAGRFSSLCHDQLWKFKLSGLRGMKILISKDINIGEKWIINHEIEFYRAAIYMLKDMPNENPIDVDEVSDFIKKLIEICNGPLDNTSINNVSAMDLDNSRPSTPATSYSNFKPNESPVLATATPGGTVTIPQFNDNNRYQFNHLLSILISDLTSAKDIVRKITQKTLSQLSDLTKLSISDLLSPGKSVLASAIYHKPLRALPVPMQTARIEAVTYCLQLRGNGSTEGNNDIYNGNNNSNNSEESESNQQQSQPQQPQSSLLEINEDLTRFVHEVLGISDAEDVAIIGQRPAHIVQLALAELRVACVRLLTAATSTSDIFQKHNQARMRIISVYFKSLYARNSDLHSVAHEGIKQVLAQSGKVPKELLQTALKPILINLSDTRRINIAGLDGLARLLELLTNYFKVEIGTKLLEHFKGILEDKASLASPKINLPPNATIQQQQIAVALANNQNNQNNLSGDLMDLNDVKIMVAIANVFRLLPAAANIYLEQFSDLIVQTESKYKRELGSPWTTPLAQYLDRFPSEANDFFFSRMNSIEHFNTYRAALLSEHASNLRKDVLDKPQRLVDTFFSQDGIKNGFALHGLKIVRALMENNQNLLSNDFNKDQQNDEHSSNILWESIWRLWSQYVQTDKPLTDDIAIRTKEIEILLEILLIHLNNNLDPGMLIYMSEIFALPLALNLIPLSRFYIKSVAQSNSQQLRQVILNHFINKFADQSLSQPHKTHILRQIINPIVLVSQKRSKFGIENIIIDENFISEMQAKVWSPLQNEEEISKIENYFFIELLNFSATLIDACPELLGDVKKSVIKFGWMSQKYADNSVRHSGNILICRFLRAFESPSKITKEVYVGLLRGMQPESKLMAKEALDILTPVLPQRVPELAPPPVSHLPQWAIWIRRVLVEEQQSAAQLSSIYSLIIRHHELFYSIRELFVPHMLNSITRMGIIPSAAYDTRQLSIDVLELILNWEKKRIESEYNTNSNDNNINTGEKRRATSESVDEPTAKRTRSSTLGNSISTQIQQSNISNVKPYVLPPNLRSHAINYLVRFASISTESISNQGSLPSRAIDLLKGFQSLDSHNDVSAKLAYFLKVLGQTDLRDENAIVHCNSAEVLSTLALSEHNSYFLNNLNGLSKIIEKVYTSNISRLHLTLEPMTRRIFSILPEINNEDESQQTKNVREFINLVESLINEGLNGHRNPHNALILLRAWTDVQVEKFDDFLQPHMRLLQIITREHCNQDKKPSYLIDPKLIPLCLELASRRVSHLGEARRIFLTCIVMLIERSNSIEVCRSILEMIVKWIVEKKENFPTAREKAGLLIKMMSYENRQYEIKSSTLINENVNAQQLSNKLFKNYLELILNIYRDPYYARSELTVRLENAFLLGCRNKDCELRSSFIKVFHDSMQLSISSRLQYVLGVQNWESLSEIYWIHQALDLVLGSINNSKYLYIKSENDIDDENDSEFVLKLKSFKVEGLIEPLRQLQYLDDQSTHEIWITIFKSAWSTLIRKEQSQITRQMIGLLAHDYHLKQVDARPNVIQTILDGVLNATPSIALPPHLVKYLGKTFECWHTSILLLEQLTEIGKETESVTETARDALAEIYADLVEEDMFYGLWRRRSGYPETNAALSYEQLGLWSEAQILHENAQIKAKSGNVPFNEPEYSIWEDHWVLCSQKLQQWDLLTDLAKNESNADLLFECAWRTSDWSQDREVIEGAFKSLPEVATPRRRIFEAFMSLVKSQDTKEQPSEFSKITTEAIQLSLKKWHSLPSIPGSCNIPLLHTFQQCVELWDANNIFQTFSLTDTNNIEQRSSEIKNIVHQWRDRMPNLWDDINLWSDLVAWRSHVFQAINKVYLPIINTLQTNSNGNQNNTGQNSFGYRGYHEMAWTINQFAHVSRKHQLQDVCISLLTKIYTLPNIEIQEAFLKLREQARCLYPTTEGLGAGLEVINNTNLHFFAPSQKSEFFTLKGMFTAKLGLHEDATQSFAHAVQTDLNLPRAWAEWGRYNDQQFKANPENMTLAANAISCYLQASGLYRSHKSRKLLARVLWLLSLDDVNMTISKAFEAYKGDFQVWYWITLIPQLLISLSHREARHARLILIQIAKKYPQALFFHLRTTREEYFVLKRQAQFIAANKNEKKDNDPSVSNNSNGHLAPPPQVMTPQLTSPDVNKQANNQGTSTLYKHPWDWVDEVLSILKTAYPLLTLSLETMVDQISARFKSTPEEDGYRFVNALLGDAIMSYATREKNQNMGLSQPTRQAMNKFVEQAVIGKVKAFTNEQGLGPELELGEYIKKLMSWRKRFEKVLDSRPRYQSLEYSRRHLVEFHLNKYDQIEIPGQYLKHEDEDRSTFLRISRIAPKYECFRSHGISLKRLTFIATNGSHHQFIVQLPPTRHVRREERTQQMSRIFNAVIERRKECRRRNIFFNSPISVPLSTTLRLVQNDSSTVSLEDIVNKHCEEIGENGLKPMISYIEKVKKVTENEDDEIMKLNLRMEIIEEINNKYVPENVLSNYIKKSTKNATEYWVIRKQMTSQIGTFIFMTYILCIAHRQPHRIMITPSNGSVYTTDVIPGLMNSDGLLKNPEKVPFRLSANLQNIMNPIGIEGVLTSTLVSLGRSLTEPEYDLGNQLNLFVREDVSSWFTSQRRISPSDEDIRKVIEMNVESIVARATVLSCKFERDNFNNSNSSNKDNNNKDNKVAPVCRSVLELIGKATNPIELAQMDAQWAPWI